MQTDRYAYLKYTCLECGHAYRRAAVCYLSGPKFHSYKSLNSVLRGGDGSSSSGIVVCCCA